MLQGISFILAEKADFVLYSDRCDSQYLKTLNSEALAILHLPQCGVLRYTSLHRKGTNLF
jgi:hypothetical protein